MPKLWDKLQRNYGFKIDLYDFYKYKFEFSADKIQGKNRDFTIKNVGSFEKFSVTTFRILPKISFSRLNKHWFTIEIQDFCLLIDGRKVKKTTANKNKKNKVKKPKVKKRPSKLRKKLNKLLKNIINTILNNSVLHFVLNNIIKHLFAISIGNVDIRYITPQNTLINYRHEKVYIYSGIEPSSIVTIDTKQFNCQEFFLRVLISPFSINHYRNIKLLPDEKLVYDFDYILTEPLFENINQTTQLLMSEESTDIILKWTGKINFRRNIELGIYINGFTIEINEIKKLMKILKQSVSHHKSDSSYDFSSTEKFDGKDVIDENSEITTHSETKETPPSVKQTPRVKKTTDDDFINYDIIETILDYLDALNIHLKFNINRLAVIKTNDKLYSLPSILITLNKLSLETSVISVPETERQIIHDSTFEIYDFVVDLFNGKMSAIYLENNEMQLFRLPYFSTIINNSSIKDIRKIEDVCNCCNLFQILVDSPEINLCETYVSMVLEELFGNKNNHNNESKTRYSRSLSFSSMANSVDNISENNNDNNNNNDTNDNNNDNNNNNNNNNTNDNTVKKEKKSLTTSQNQLFLTLLEYFTLYASIHIVNPSFKMRLSKNTVRSHLPKFPSHHFLIFATHIDEIYIKGIVHNLVSSEECRSYMEKIRTNQSNDLKITTPTDTFNPNKSVLFNIIHSDLYDPTPISI